MDRTRNCCGVALLGLAILATVGGAQAQPTDAMLESERYIAIKNLTLEGPPDKKDAGRLLQQAGLIDAEPTVVEGVSSTDTTVFKLRPHRAQTLSLEQLIANAKQQRADGDGLFRLSVLPSDYAELFSYRTSLLHGAEATAVADMRGEIRQTFGAKKVHVVAATPADAVLAQLLRASDLGLADSGGNEIAFTSGHPTIELNLQLDGRRRFRATHAEAMANGSVVMEGTVLDGNGRPSGPGALVAGPNGVQGTFHVDGRIIDLRPATYSPVDLTDLVVPQTSLLSEAPVISPFADHSDWLQGFGLADGGDAAADAPSLPDSAPLEDAATSQGHIVDLIVAVTPAAKRLANKVNRPIADAIHVDIALVNGYLASQRLGLRLRLVANGIVDVEYEEAKCSTDCSAATERRDLHAFREGTAFKNFRDLRKQSRADVAVLVMDIFQRPGHSSPCGQAAALSAKTPSQAMFIVDFACLNMTMNFTIMHELGHLLGANHNAGAPLPSIAQAGSLGFVSADAAWRDVMSYPDACGGCQRKPFFSSMAECLFMDPNNSNLCVPIGSAESNALPTMRAHALRLSNIAETAWQTP